MRHRPRSTRKWVLPLFSFMVVFVTILSVRGSYFYLQHRTSSNKTHKPGKSNRLGKMVGISPPRVDRSILDKLRSLDADECLIEASSRAYWPPKVTRLPIDDSPRLVRDASLDINFCGVTPCRLLLPAFIGEQESKARRHLLQLAHLAHAINRTLVLPNVARSRLGTCAKWDFELYYEPPDAVPGVRVSFEGFRRWVAQRAGHPQAQVIEVLAMRSPLALRDTVDEEGQVVFSGVAGLRDPEHVEVAISASRDPTVMGHNHCLRTRARNLRFGDFSPVQIYPRAFASASAGAGSASMRREDWLYFGRELIATLTSPRVAAVSKRVNDSTVSEPDVLVFNWEVRHPVFPLVRDTALPYARRWTHVAASLATRLQPFIAIHWRMERVSPSALPSCAPLLANTLFTLLTDTPGITAVYLATDYPTEGEDAPHSGTFRVGEEHRVAMRMFERAFGDVVEARGGGVRLTGLVGELEAGGLDVELGHEGGVLLGGAGGGDRDAGLMGIVDKMVAVRAALFISGGPGCGKTR